MDSLLPTSVKSPRFLAFEQAIARVSALDYASLNIFDIDNASEELLLNLADQFNVLGLRGWSLADTLEKKRLLVSRALELNRYAGTPWAVIQALDSLGYKNAQIIENPGNRYDGSFTYDGTIAYAGDDPYGKFIVILDPVFANVPQDQRDLVVALINEWKNVRSTLADLRIGDVSLFSNPLRYDGSFSYDGTQTYDGDFTV